VILSPLDTLKAMIAGAHPHSSRAAHCVIWHAANTPLDHELLDTLTKKGVHISARAESPFAAFAQVALDCRGIAAHQVTASMLIVVEPRLLPSVDEVWRILQRHGMRTVMWVFEAAESPRLRPFEPTPTPFESAQPKPRFGSPPPATNPHVVPNPVSTSSMHLGVAFGPPKLRLAGEASTPSNTPSNTQSETHGRAPTSILTDAELAMLLSDDPANP